MSLCSILQHNSLCIVSKLPIYATSIVLAGSPCVLGFLWKPTICYWSSPIICDLHLCLRDVHTLRGEFHKPLKSLLASSLFGHANSLTINMLDLDCGLLSFFFDCGRRCCHRLLLDDVSNDFDSEWFFNLCYNFFNDFTNMFSWFLEPKCRLIWSRAAKALDLLTACQIFLFMLEHYRWGGLQYIKLAIISRLDDPFVL